jgi:hypothetical protein
VFGLTPLALSCYFNGLESVTYLLNRSANIETFDNCGRTPLHLAVLKGNEVPLLMNHLLFLLILKIVGSLRRGCQILDGVLTVCTLGCNLTGRLKEAAVRVGWVWGSLKVAFYSIFRIIFKILKPPPSSSLI